MNIRQKLLIAMPALMLASPTLAAEASNREWTLIHGTRLAVALDLTDSVGAGRFAAIARSLTPGHSTLVQDAKATAIEVHAARSAAHPERYFMIMVSRDNGSDAQARDVATYAGGTGGAVLKTAPQFITMATGARMDLREFGELGQHLAPGDAVAILVVDQDARPIDLHGAAF